MTQEEIDKVMAQEVPAGQTRFMYQDDDLKKTVYVVITTSKEKADKEFFKYYKDNERAIHNNSKPRGPISQ